MCASNCQIYSETKTLGKNFKNYNIFNNFSIFFLNFLDYLVFELDGSAHFEARPAFLYFEPTF